MQHGHEKQQIHYDKRNKELIKNALLWHSLYQFEGKRKKKKDSQTVITWSFQENERL